MREAPPPETQVTHGRAPAVTRPLRFSMLSGGILGRDQDNSYMNIPYESTLMLHTIFDS